MNPDSAAIVYLVLVISFLVVLFKLTEMTAQRDKLKRELELQQMQDSAQAKRDSFKLRAIGVFIEPMDFPAKGFICSIINDDTLPNDGIEEFSEYMRGLNIKPIERIYGED